MALPELLAHNLKAYVQHGHHPGGFLARVLANDVLGAVSLADSESKAALGEICAVITSKLPGNCYGTPERVQAWVGFHGIDGGAPKKVP